jgi:glyoxylase-like metal-dependent hydrolase (beta-lactamase superfamily II)
MKKRYKILLSLAALIAGAWYWLLIDNRPGSDVAPLDIAALRVAANAVPGEKGTGIAVETAARGSLPETLLVAGASITSGPQGVHAFRVDIPSGSVIIDTGMDQAAADAMGVYTLDLRAQDRIVAALPSAKAIIVTHEHLDHIGGVLTSADWSKISQKALITREQFDHPEETDPVVWPNGSRQSFKPHDYEGVKGIAPGVAVMKAASHTPGSQIVIAQLADGREFLFMGDISSMDRNWLETRARSRLIGDVIINEERNAVFAWLKAFKAASVANPKLIMVPSHDSRRIDEMVESGTFTRSFKPEKKQIP